LELFEVLLSVVGLDGLTQETGSLDLLITGSLDHWTLDYLLLSVISCCL